MLLPEEYKDIGEYYEDGKDNLDLLLSNKIDLIEFSIDSLIKKEDTGDKRIILVSLKSLLDLSAHLIKILLLIYFPSKLILRKIYL